MNASPAEGAARETKEEARRIGASKGFRHPRHHAPAPQRPQFPTPPPSRTNITPNPLAKRSYQTRIEPPAGRRASLPHHRASSRPRS
jgi:hypothetical protein